MTAQRCSRSTHLLLLLAILAGLPSCGDQTATTGATAGSAPTATAAEPGYFTGRITRLDGSPINVPGAQYRITIAGVTAVGENSSFEPAVGADGTFSLKLPPGQFRPPYGTISVPFEGKNYSLWLEPVAPANGMRDSAQGIAQTFVWRLTGPRPGTANPDVNNATHWFGSSISLIASTFRNDIGQNAKPLADGSKIVWTLTPTSSTLIDGTAAKPLTVERTWHAGGSTYDALNDLPAANYNLSAVATLPDGATQRLVLTDLQDALYKPVAKLTLQPEESLHHYVYLPLQVSWAVE